MPRPRPLPALVLAGLFAGLIALPGSGSDEAPAAAPTETVRLVVILTDPSGTPRIADALNCPLDVRVFHTTGEPQAADWLRYSFTPHATDRTQHWTVSF